MKQHEVSEEFERFAAAHGRAVWEEVRKRRRDAEGNPNWRPNTLEGMCLSKPSSQNSLGKVLPVTASECGGPHSYEELLIAVATEPTSTHVDSNPICRLVCAGLVRGNASERASHAGPSGTDASRQRGIVRGARGW
jgi:hypothetical protein